MQAKKGGSAFKSTEIGRLNRSIEKSVSGVATGDSGATSKAIDLARKREKLLTNRNFRRKEPA